MEDMEESHSGLSVAGRVAGRALCAPGPVPDQVRARPARRLLVIGLVANEFAQPRESGWGSTLLLRPELRGVSVATIEPRPGCNVVRAM